MILEHEKYRSTERKEGKLINLDGYIIEDFDFSGQYLSGLSARMSQFNNCKFINCDLYHAYFSGSEFSGVDFSDSVLVKAELYEVKARQTRFDRANLRGAEFLDAKLEDVSFQNADLGGGILSGSELIRSSFYGANIEGAAVDENKEIDTNWVNVTGRDESA